MKRAVLTAAFLVLGCGREVPAPASRVVEVQKAPDDSAERVSILDLAHGACVIGRTGEAMLEVSALRAFDGDPGSFWMSPLHDLPQSATVALPAQTRINFVGLRTIAKGGFTAKDVLFEGSPDGKTFTKIATVAAADTGDPQWFPLQVSPPPVMYVRVTMLDSPLPNHDVRLYSVLARGAELEPPHPGDITGCWMVNGRKASFARRGVRVTGSMEMGNQPITFEGGFDGRIYRLQWIRGNDYGLALLDVSPDGNHLSGMEWHEEAIPMFVGDSWFGEKGDCGTPPPAVDGPMALLRRTGRFSLYDDSELPRLLRSAPNAVLVAHEFRFAGANENREAARRALDALIQRYHLSGVKNVVQGSDAPRQEPVTEAMRALYSTVDLEIRR